MFNWFKKKTPVEEKPKPKWGEYRIVRMTYGDGREKFEVDMYGFELKEYSFTLGYRPYWMLQKTFDSEKKAQEYICDRKAWDLKEKIISRDNIPLKDCDCP